MVSNTQQRMTLAEYLTYDDGTDTRYELVNGELVEMPFESDINNAIAILLILAFAQYVPGHWLRRATEIVVSDSRATTRVPDVMVLTEETAAALAGASRSIILFDMPSPQLVVEVVSPGSSNENRDYRHKRSEYAARKIPEYWIVDPEQKRVTVLTLVEGLYEEAVFMEGDFLSETPCDRLRSLTFPTLELTAAQVLSGRL
jgi:Uma2 family endonuclease